MPLTAAGDTKDAASHYAGKNNREVKDAGKLRAGLDGDWTDRALKAFAGLQVRPEDSLEISKPNVDCLMIDARDG